MFFCLKDFDQAEKLLKKHHDDWGIAFIYGEPYFDAGTPMGSVQEAYEYWKRNKSTLRDKRIISWVASYLDAMKGVQLP